MEGKSSLQKTAEDNTLLQKTTEDILPTDRLHVIPTLSLVKSKEDSSMFKFKFGRKEASEMHVKDPEVGVKEQTPRKIQRRLEEMRAKPVLMKDAARSTRSDNLSQERSLQCTAGKIVEANWIHRYGLVLGRQLFWALA